jgi:hypothetical protein
MMSGMSVSRRFAQAIAAQAICIIDRHGQAGRFLGAPASS